VYPWRIDFRKEFPVAESLTLKTNPRLTAEEFEDEIVLLDVSRGLYFSVGGSAIALWRAFGSPRDASAVVEALCLRLAGADRPALEEAVARMRQNGLLVPAEETGFSPFDVPAAPFVPPGVEVFKDLADLISIDPVHEVDAASGWPVKPPGFPDAR
jgi:hypothetical protein